MHFMKKGQLLKYGIDVLQMTSEGVRVLRIHRDICNLGKVSKKGPFIAIRYLRRLFGCI